MKNKIKILSAVLLSTLIATGCASSSISSSSSESVAQTDGEKAEDNEETVTEEEVAADEAATPLQEIIDSDIHSGYVQIGNDIFRNGGYITVGEFIDTYGDKWTCTNTLTLSKEIDEDYSFSYSFMNKDGAKLLITVRRPVSGTGTLKDGVIISFLGSDAPEYLPGGVPKDSDLSPDEAAALFEKNGLVFKERDNDSFLHNPKALEDLGTYSRHVTDWEGDGDDGYHSEIIIGCYEGTEPNLYGYVPTYYIRYSIMDYAKETKRSKDFKIFHYQTVYYIDNDYYNIITI